MKSLFLSSARQRSPLVAGIATDAVPVTPSDTVDLPSGGIGVYVEIGGPLSFVSAAGGTRTITVADNSYHPIAVTRIRASGTTASGIHLLVL